MMNTKREIEESAKYIFELEQEIYSSEFEKIQYKKAKKLAVKKKKGKEKWKLIFDIFLEKLGRIPYCEVEEYRTDAKIREIIQALRNEIILLEEAHTEKKLEIEPEYKVLSDLEEKREQPKNDLENKTGYIAFLVNSLDKGGLEQIVALLAMSFFERKIAIKVMCLDDGGAVADQLAKAGIEVLVFHGNGNAFRKYIKNNPPRIVNTHYVKRHIKFLYKQNIPVIEVIHNMYVFYCRHVTKIERKNEKYFSQLIAVSELVKKTYCEKVVQSDKITVIGNAAILREDSTKSKEEVRETLGIPQDAYVILNVGSIDSRKNQLGILEVYNIVAKLVEVPLYLVFAGNIQDENYNKKFMDAISKCENKSQVICMSYYEKIRELYQMANVLMLDSYYEGWSIAATEALYEGLPIIHSMCGSAIELTADGRYGVTISNPAGNLSQVSNSELNRSIARGENRNTRDAVRALRYMIKNRQYWEKQRTNISMEARKKYSIDNFIQNYIDIFEKIEERKENG